MPKAKPAHRGQANTHVGAGAKEANEDFASELEGALKSPHSECDASQPQNLLAEEIKKDGDCRRRLLERRAAFDERTTRWNQGLIYPFLFLNTVLAVMYPAATLALIPIVFSALVVLGGGAQTLAKVLGKTGVKRTQGDAEQ